MKQVKFRDKENDNILGGILLDDGNVLCGECGSVLDRDDVEILDEYLYWVDLSETIIGDD